MNELTTVSATRASLQQAMYAEGQGLFSEIMKSSDQHPVIAEKSEISTTLNDEEKFIIQRKVNDEVKKQRGLWIASKSGSEFKFDKTSKELLLEALQQEVFAGNPEKMAKAKREVANLINRWEFVIRHSRRFQELVSSIQDIQLNLP